MKKDLTPEREGEKWQASFELREDGEYHCRLCMACFPVHSPERARNHLWIKHGVELEPEVVELRESRQLPEQTFKFVTKE